jgi:chorismate dehydratase
MVRHLRRALAHCPPRTDRYAARLVSLRVGTVPYLVARPLNRGLERERGLELVRAVPALLIDGLRDGSLDVALVSSIELFRTPGYAYLAGPAVAGRGFVASVQVFLRRPVGALRSIVLDPASRTAQVLAQITLARRERDVRFVEVPLGVDPRAAAEAEDHGGWLRIGDAALAEYLGAEAPRVFNPSEAWTADTRLPFVFALWIVRPGVELSPDQLTAFANARARGAASIEELARDASVAWKLPHAACRKYLLEECRYDPGDELEPALLAFRDAAAALGLCRGDLSPRAIAVGGADAALDR